MGDLKGWNPGKRTKPPAYTPTKRRSSRVFDDDAPKVRRRNPGRAARPEHLVDDTSRPPSPDSGVGSLFVGSPSVSGFMRGSGLFVFYVGIVVISG